jgi:uncharacterized NAD(P)/FAD-binding protein YdhS
VVIAGTGLTMIDAVIALLDQGHEGRVTANLAPGLVAGCS